MAEGRRTSEVSGVLPDHWLDALTRKILIGRAYPSENEVEDQGTTTTSALQIKYTSACKIWRSTVSVWQQQMWRWSTGATSGSADIGTPISIVSCTPFFLQSDDNEVSSPEANKQFRPRRRRVRSLEFGGWRILTLNFYPAQGKNRGLFFSTKIRLLSGMQLRPAINTIAA
eukprot:scaffold11138_cov76-Skeletonema_dohrnii-CCMP3373.AAC.1